MSNLVLLAVVVLISIYITIRAFIKFRWEYMGWNIFTITYFGGFIGWPLIMTIIAGYPLVVEEIGHNISILFHIAMIGLPVTAYLMAGGVYKKRKKKFLADIVALLQSPAKNVISALQSGGNTLHGVLKTLGERPE